MLRFNIAGKGVNPPLSTTSFDPQGLKLALANSQNASENKKSRVQSSNLSHFLRVQKNRGKQTIWANIIHN